MSATAIQIENERITFDGYDLAVSTDVVVKRINVWRDYDNRALGAICSVRHGHPAELLERKGDACRVRVTWMGRTYEGWVTYYFFKELKGEWQLERIKGASA